MPGLTKDEISARVDDLVSEATGGDLTDIEIAEIVESRVWAAISARRATNILTWKHGGGRERFRKALRESPNKED